MSNANLDNNAQYIFGNAYSSVKTNNGKLTFSRDELEAAIIDAVNEAAGSACIYTKDCYEIINRYESQVGDVDDMGETFKLSEWERAMSLYAACVAQTYLMKKTSSLADDLFDEAGELLAFAHEHGASDELTVADITIQDKSSFGWEAHKLEDEEGRCYWQRVEGEIDAAESTFEGYTLGLSWNSTK